jgi:hypothetical protein
VSNRGYFEIGIYRTKCAANVGTLWRSAFQLVCSGIEAATPSLASAWLAR